MKSRRIRWAGHVVCMVIGEVRRRFWLGKMMERDPEKDLGVDRRIILKWIFKK